MFNIELHAFCLLLVILLYLNMRNSCLRDEKKPERTISAVFFLLGLVLVSDCLWTLLEESGRFSAAVGYFVNIVYFLCSNIAAACWFLFCVFHLHTQSSRDSNLCYLTLVPCALVCVFCMITPWNGYIFSIENGRYVRGILFFIDPMVKLGYIVATAVLSIVFAKTREYKYMRTKDYALIFYSVPVIICGIFQIIFGGDFNCIGFTIGLVLIYLMGVTNTDLDNIDTIYSLAYSFEALYLVNIYTGEIRAIRKGDLHSSDMPEMKSRDYTEHFLRILDKILVPEDREATLNAFELDNVVERFNTERTFSLRYRVMEESGQVSLRMALFIHAPGKDGREEFLIGIRSIQPENLLYERNQALSRENERLEEVNKSIIVTVAKIVEARDSDSGEHIVRVQELTKILADEVMRRYPEYGLDEKMVELISSASVLHDVGKVVIPDAVLLKPERLTAEEFELMKTHTVRGNEILNSFPLGLDDAFLGFAAMICRSHHEKYDGNGYPDGLKGDEIPIAAQIVSVVDCYDALVSNRPYKKAYTPEMAYKMILNGECGAFSDKIMTCFKNSKNEFAGLSKKSQ